MENDMSNEQLIAISQVENHKKVGIDSNTTTVDGIDYFVKDTIAGKIAIPIGHELSEEYFVKIKKTTSSKLFKKLAYKRYKALTLG